jgi:tellurium resistance protein TerD
MASLAPDNAVALSAGDPGLVGVVVTTEWAIEPAAGPLPEPVSLAVVCGDNGRALTPDDLIFFNQPTTASPGIALSPTTAGPYDPPARAEEGAEQIEVDFRRVPDDVGKIAFVTYIDPEVRGAGNFAPVRSLTLTVSRPDGSEIVRFDAPLDDAEKIQAALIGELFRDGDGWAFRAVGRGYRNGLAGVGIEFGLDV